MSLAPGTRLGPYEIVAPIGAGGMGEVYRARDAKLNRTVAIKVLPESLAADADRLMRFEREAQMLAALNHPHIAQIYGLEGRNGQEGQEGSSCIVMELVEGPTLADRIGQGPIPFAEAMSIATQIADALAAAHDQGIVHRDLKPANIKVRGDGIVKVLDFGLAKALDPHPSKSAAVTSPTLSVHATQAGIILGTAAYMAPEQALGKAVDKRADIWAFGVVLFEMLTGRRPFGGGDEVVATIAAVVKDAPLFAELSPDTPAAIRRLLRRCLEKDPRHRLADIADARLEIADSLEGKHEPAVSTPLQSGRRERAWQIAAALLAVVAAAGWWSWSREVRSVVPPAHAAQRVDLDLGLDLALESIGPAVILSPDGTRLVYVSKRSDGRTRLLTKLLDQPKPIELPGTEDGYGPFFSPDGRWVGFFAAGKLKKVRVDGGQLVTLCDAAVGRGASWSDDGTFIVAALDNQNVLARIPAAGGRPVPITKFQGEERSHRWPHVVPGRQAVVFTVNSSPGNFDNSGVAVVSFSGSGNAVSDHRVLFADAGMYPRLVAGRYLTFVKKGTLYAAPFDVSQLNVRGAPAPVLEEVSNVQDFGSAQLDLSSDGTLLYHRGGTIGLRTIHWLDSTGATEPLLEQPGMYAYPRMSPDGERLAFALADGTNTDIWVYAWRTGTRQRITEGAQHGYPVWSPDGRYLVLAGASDVLWAPADAAQRPKVLMSSQGTVQPHSFTPDGHTLAFSERSADGKWSIKTSVIQGTSIALQAGKPELFVDIPSGNVSAAFSPDGRWLAYSTAESRVNEVYVRAFPDRGTKRLISSGGGTMPSWSRDGKTLFYRTADQRIMAVAYSAKGDAFAAEPPRVWSERRIANTGMTANLDIAPDGTRFAVLMPAEAPEPQDTRGHFTLVPNFVEEVRRRLNATGK